MLLVYVSSSFFFNLNVLVFLLTFFQHLLSFNKALRSYLLIAMIENDCFVNFTNLFLPIHYTNRRNQLFYLLYRYTLSRTVVYHLLHLVLVVHLRKLKIYLIIIKFFLTKKNLVFFLVSLYTIYGLSLSF